MNNLSKLFQAGTISGFVMIVAITIFALTICAAGIGYVTSQWRLSYDARIVDLGVCLAPTSPVERVNVLSTTVDSIYVCGYVDGTTILPVSITLYNQEEVLFQVNETLQPGSFLIEVQPWKFNVPPPTGPDALLPGRYSVRMSRMRATVAEAEFLVKHE